MLLSEVPLDTTLDPPVRIPGAQDAHVPYAAHSKGNQGHTMAGLLL